MTLLRYLHYMLACQLYTLRLVLYWGHSGLVFLSKPGARIIVPVALFGFVYALQAPLEAAVGAKIDTLWQSLVQPVFGTDLARLTQPLNIEITAVALLLLLALVMMLLASMLQPVIGALWAPRMPLPPLPPLLVPDTEVKAVPVTRLLKPQLYAPLPRGLESLSQGLPEELQGLVLRKVRDDRPNNADRFARPPVAPETEDGGTGQGMAQGTLDLPPTRREPPQRPKPPPVAAPRATPPAQRPKSPGSP
jgi:hypothetical protein